MDCYLQDGSVIIHTVRKGSYIRTLWPPCERMWSLSVELLCISDVGQICIYCKQSSSNVSKEVWCCFDILLLSYFVCCQ